MIDIYKQNYDKVIDGIDGSLIVLFRLYMMNLTKRGEEWRFSENFYSTESDSETE